MGTEDWMGVGGRARVNRTRHVTGQRADGYHLLDSLVAFADVGDALRMRLSEHMSLSVTGPMAAGVPADARNLVWRAAVWFGLPAEIVLEKNVPPASGIGGGSSDAAATLIGLARLSGRAVPDPKSTAALGADVPVCLQRAACRMTGIGDTVMPLVGIPDVPMVLINPGKSVSTPEVFQNLRQKTNPPMSADLPQFQDILDLARWLGAQRNDLEAPARAICPAIDAVLSALGRADSCLLARMSGSGATCFGLFPDRKSAQAAAESVEKTHPRWWVAPPA